MIKKIIETILLILPAIVLPLLGKPALLLTWPIWIAVLFGAAITISQPPMSGEAKKSNAHDRYSMLLILLGALFCFIVPISDYAYGKPKIILIEQTSTWLGLLMIFGGFFFRYWSIQVLGKFFTSKVHIQSDHELIQNGPYKLLRHPSYTGAWISMIGISLFFQSKMGLVFSIFVYFLIYIYRIECEEKALEGIFGDAYVQYRKKTWGILPFIY